MPRRAQDERGGGTTTLNTLRLLFKTHSVASGSQCLQGFQPDYYNNYNKYLKLDIEKYNTHYIKVFKK